MSQIREYADPSCDTLLPEMAPELVGRVKTLVLDLEGLLVHKEWSRAKGWQVGGRTDRAAAGVACGGDPWRPQQQRML